MSDGGRIMQTFQPAPIKCRLKTDYAAITKKRDGYCIAGLFLKDGCSGGLDAHHIDSRGSGGEDVLTNLIDLCRRHHQDAEAKRITKADLRGFLTRLYGYQYE
jgi:hypothetical protein